MKVSDLERVYDYGYWANRKLFAVVSQLSADEFTRSVGGSYGSIRNTLVHILSAEWGWLDRCGGPSRGKKLDPADYPTFDSIVAQWTKVEAYVREFLSKLSDADMARVVEYANERGEKRSIPVSELLQHAASHGSHHRGQVALLLRMLAHAPGNVDMLLYDAERRDVPAS